MTIAELCVDASLHLKVPVSRIIEMTMPLLELTLRRQDARDAERDIAMMQMVNAGAAPLTGSKVGEEIFVTTLRRLQRIAHGLPPQPEGSTAFQRLLDHALSQQGAQSAKRT